MKSLILIWPVLVYAAFMIVVIIYAAYANYNGKPL